MNRNVPLVFSTLVNWYDKCAVCVCALAWCFFEMFLSDLRSPAGGGHFVVFRGHCMSMT